MRNVASTMPSPEVEREEPLENVHMTKLTIVNNLVIISMSFLLTFTAFFGTRNLQTSLYSENLGNYNLAITNFTAILSSLLLATLVVYKLGLKWSLIISLLTRILHPASNLYPVWYLMYLGAAIAGIGTGPLWTAKSAYLTQLGEEYAKLSGKLPEVVISSFFGVFFMFFSGSMFTGNIISSFIFRRPPSTDVYSEKNDVIIRSLCGAHYCYEDLDIAFGRAAVNLTATSGVNSIYHPTTFQINLLFSIYVVCTVLAVLLAAFTAPISTSGQMLSANIVESLLITLKHMRKQKEILLIPLSLLNGVTFAFITADYCVAFITCSVGIDNIGYVMAVFGATSGIGSILTAPATKLMGRKAIFGFGGVINGVAIVGMLAWQPGTHSMIILCVLAGLWGTANAVWSSQLVSFIAFVFRDGYKEAAFASQYLWQSLSFAMWHLTSPYMCLNVQLYVMACTLTAGMAGYTVIEILLRAEEEEEQQDEQHHMQDDNRKIHVERVAHSPEESRDQSDMCSTRF